jgi:NAD(P)-dependent dehydrogenase (short-subunit alcohol dehydrogenase family)
LYRTSANYFTRSKTLGRLIGKVALVTAAGGGIGKAIAPDLANEGAALVLAARTLSRLQETAQEIEAGGGAALAVQTDVTNEAQVAQLFQRAMQAFHRLEVLVNNAGLVEGAPLDESPLEKWERVMATNLTGPFLCTREAMRIMKPQGGGRIIDIGSISAQRLRANSAAYSASKFGLWGLTLTTTLEGREHGISASCLHPGNVHVESPGAPEISPPGEPSMEVTEIAETAILMASLPPHVSMLEAIVLPVKQPYLGRG